MKTILFNGRGNAAIINICSLICLLVMSKAPGATFAPTEEELAAAVRRGVHGTLGTRPFPQHHDEKGRTYIQIDDMKFIVKEGRSIESAFTGTRWTNGTVYYVFDGGVTSTNRQNWRDAADEWTATAPVNFIEGTGAGNYIYVQNGGGNNSYIGMIGGQQIMNIVNWDVRFIIAHEVGHALGLIHEHQRSDRDSFVSIEYGNIQSGYEGNFDSAASTNYDSYDFDSVMHYDKCAFSIDCPPGFTCACTNYTIVVLQPYTAQWQDAIGQRDHLSQFDGTGMAQRYAGGGSTPPNDQCGGAIALANNVARTDNTASATSTGDPFPSCVSTFGNGVWYTFTPANSGTVTISTCGSDFDTVLEVYTGSCAGLTAVPGGCNDDNGPNCSGTGGAGSVSFAGTGGTTYRILAGGYGGAIGNLQIVAQVTGTGPTRVISLSGNLAFGSVAVGATAQHTMTIANNGNSTLTVSSISYPNAFSGSYSGTIAAGGSHNVTVTFAPTAVTTYSGSVIVNSNATSGTNTIQASGTGASNITLGALTLLPAPLRLVDTRSGSGYVDAGNHYFNDTLRTYDIIGLAGGAIPSGAQAIIGRASVVNAGASGGLQESPNPPVSGNDLGQGTAIINFPSSTIISALGSTFTSALDNNGRIRLHATIGGGSVDVIVDIVGYYQ